MQADVRLTPTEAKADHLQLTTPNSSMGNFFSFSYTNFHAFLDFTNEVILKADFNQSTVSMKDGHFIPAAEKNDEKMIADGEVKGTISNLKPKI
jgi:hypothetical protein